MKKRLIAVCISLVMLSACQKNEFENSEVSNPDERVALGIGSATASMTKALITPGPQTTDGMAIGLFATGTDYYVDESSLANHSATFTYSSNTWGTDANIYLTAAPATIYGYFPATATLTKDASTPKVAVSVLETGAEITTISNTVFNAASDEVDYMAFLPAAGKGRLTNNGKANDGVATDNNLGDNPGFTIPDLTLEHGMAMVSFKLYNDGGYKGKADWTQFVLKNATGKEVLSKGTSPVMSLVDAAITPGAFVAATLTRTLASKAYTVPVVAEGTDADAAKAAANKISCLVLPISTAFNAGDIQVVLTVDGVAYPAINIPATAVNVWEKGKNYIYTLKLGGHGIELTNVTVTNWTDVDGGEIPVN